MKYARAIFQLSCVTFGSLLFFVSTSLAQQIDITKQIWSVDVIRPSGQPIIPTFDGWFPNEDGTRTLCFGYNSLNTEQVLDIPLGKDNYFSDDRFEVLLPTHFDPIPPVYRRHFCVFTVLVPADFGRDETVEWHLTSAGAALIAPGNILGPYQMDEPSSLGRGNIAPVIKLTEDGEGVRGRNGIHSNSSVRAKVNQAVQLSAWIEHPDEEIWIGWAKHTGPGIVEFDEPEYRFEPMKGPATVETTFSEPGRYVIRMQTINTVAAFEFYCCHSTGYITVDISN